MNKFDAIMARAYVESKLKESKLKKKIDEYDINYDALMLEQVLEIIEVYLVIKEKF